MNIMGNLDHQKLMTKIHLLTLKGEKRIAPASLSVPCDHISSLLPALQGIPARDVNHVNALQQMQFYVLVNPFTMLSSQ